MKQIMSTEIRKYEVSDPAYYDPLISDQKKRIKGTPHDPGEWLELGRLHEAKIDLTHYFAKQKIWVRYSFPMMLLLVLLLMIISADFVSNLDLQRWPSNGLLSVLIAVSVASTQWMLSLRYPKSGRKFFRKTIALDPDCGEAYMFLGLIALRRYQKRKGCLLLEQALRLGIKHSKIEKQLTSIYEKEFMTFFKSRSEKEIKQQQIIDTQRAQIKALRSKVASLINQTQNLNNRVDQVKWDAGHKAKFLKKEMQRHVKAIRKKYEDQIAAKELAHEHKKEVKELAERDFVRLTTEVVEAKAALEVQSLKASAKTVEKMLGPRPWQVLLDQTKTYMATAEQIYSVLNEQEENSDYSLVGMEICKALETELNQILVDPFVQNLNGNRATFLKVNQTGENKGKPLYFTYLAKIVDHANYPEVTALTLGQYHFILKQALAGDYALRDYADFLRQRCSDSEAGIGKAFLKKLRTVTKTYRNNITHRSPMDKKEYEHLRKLIFAGRDSLLKICCQIGASNR